MKLISYAEAKTLGLTRYFTGKPCSKGHISERNAANRACLQCQKLIAERIYQRKRLDKEFMAECRRRANQWGKDNPEKAMARYRAWVAANPERAREISRAGWLNRKARESEAGTCSADVIASIRAAGKCANCSTKRGPFEIDHIMPLSKGGKHVKHNLQLLCKPCNRKKHAKDPIAWARENGRLI